MKIQIINPIEYRGWDELLLTTDQSCFFHTSAWAEVLQNAYGYKPLYFSVIEDDRLTGLIPVMDINSVFTGRRGVGLPFTDFSPPLANGVDEFKALLQKVIDYGLKANWKSIEFRGGSKLFGETLSSAMYLTHSLDLNKDENNVYDLFKSSTRRNIRKAEREDVKVNIAHTLEAVNEFYLLNCSTRKMHGLPPQPRRFFLNLYKYIISKGKGFVALATQKGMAIAGGVYLQFRNQGIYKYGASDFSLQHLRPNNLVMWEAIKWFCRKGYKSFDFGRTEPENKGLLQFKRGWGTSEYSLAYYKYAVAAGAFVSDEDGPKTSYKCFKLMPSPLLRVAGNLLYRHVG